MRKTLLAFVFFIAVTAFAAGDGVKKTPAHAYVEKYASMAVAEMHRTGVPASITLAQGILESGCGQSELAVKANNHFGIQCHSSWKGPKYKAKDNGRWRDFRKYESAAGSYQDHSDFLKKNKRYSSLFELEITDYKGWAHGLKAAHYAEDVAYAVKLIDLIERYELYVYDTMDEVPAVAGKPDTDDKPSEGYVPADQPSGVVVVEVEEPLTERQRRAYRYNLARQMYSQNGVPFVYSCAGETYADIARQYNLFLGEILKFNDVKEDRELQTGVVVYVQAKKAKAAKGYDEYKSEGGMSMWEISQKYGVKLKKLCRRNGVDESYVPQAGEVIVLR